MNSIFSSAPAVRPAFINRFFLFRSEMDRMLLLSMTFSCLLVVARVLFTGRLTFIFLGWNLFLAYIPYMITEWLAIRPAWIKNKGVFFAFFAVWLLVIPNAFYIITDLFHLGDQYNDNRAPRWFDLAMILSFAWNGLLLGILSVRRMEKFMQAWLSGRHELIFLYPICWLNAFGVYVGRYLRFNSWDVVSDPFQLLRDIALILLHPLEYRNAWGMVLCFSILMTFIYLSIKRISKALV